MINLLSYDKKRQIRAARANVILVKCVIFTAFAILFLATYCIIAYNFVIDSKESQTANVSDGQSLDSKSTTILSQTNSFKADLETAKAILDTRVSYSKIITELTKTLPTGVVIDSLTMNSDSISSPISLSLRATTNAKKQEIKDGFKKSTIFSGYSEKSVSENKDDASGYPLTILSTVLIKKEAR